MVKIDLIIFTDLWRVNGSFRSSLMVSLVDQAHSQNHTVRVFSPRDCPISFFASRYSDRRIGLLGFWRIWNILNKNKFQSIHIATPRMLIGTYARIACWILGLDYSTDRSLGYPRYVKSLVDKSKKIRSAEAYGEAAANILHLVMR